MNVLIFNNRYNWNKKGGSGVQDIVLEVQDMRYLDWAVRKMSPGTPGCFLKAYEEVDG